MAREFRMGARIELNTRGYESSMSQAVRATDNIREAMTAADRSAGRFTDSSGRLRDANGRFVSSATRATEATRRQQREMTGLSGVYQRFRTRVTESVRQLRDQNAQMRETTSTAQTMRNVFAALGGAMALRGAYTWMIDSNASMEQYKNTLTTVLKSEEKAIETLAWANKFAADTPFEIPQIMEAVTVMSAYGMTAKDSLGIIGDMASVMGKDLMQAVEAVADAQTGELERLKEFGITKKMIEEQAKLMNKAVFDKKGSMKDQEAFNEVLFAMMDERFKGGMAMQAKTFKGMVSNAQDYVGTIGRKLGQPIFDKMKSGLEGLLETANRLQEDGSVDRWIAKVQDGFGKVWGVLQKTGPYFKMAFDIIKQAFDIGKGAVDYFVDNFKRFEPIIYAIAGAFLFYKGVVGAISAAIWVVSKAQLIWNTVMALNPVFLVIVAIGALIGYLIYLAGGWDFVKEKLLAFWGFLKAVWAWAVPYIQAAIAAIREALIAWASRVWTTVQPFLAMLMAGITQVLNSIKAFWDKWGAAIMITIQLWATFWVSIFKSAFEIIWIVIKGAFDLIYGIVANAFTAITGIIQIAWSIITGIFTAAFQLLTGDWQGAWQTMIDMLGGVKDGLVTWFTGLKDLFFDSGKAIITTLADGITAAVKAPVKAVKAVLGKVREFLPFSDAKRGPLSNLTLNGSKIITTMAAGMYSASGTMTGAMNDVLGVPSVSGETSIAAGTANPAGGQAGAKGGRGAAVIIQKLVEKIEIYGADGKSAAALVDELIAELYERFKNADEILSAAGLGGLLNDD